MANITEYIGQSREFLGEVAVELRKGYWPPRKETIGFTGVGVIIVAFVAVYLGLVDYLLSLFMGLVF